VLLAGAVGYYFYAGLGVAVYSLAGLGLLAAALGAFLLFTNDAAKAD